MRLVDGSETPVGVVRRIQAGAERAPVPERGRLPVRAVVVEAVAVAQVAGLLAAPRLLSGFGKKGLWN